MQEVMDRLYEAMTALDREIAASERAPATIGALLRVSRLELARTLVRRAQTALARVPDRGSSDQTATKS